MASLDATVVNVALPSIGDDFDAGVGALQWVLTGYLLALASLFSSAVRSATGTAGAVCS
jgi:MFS family permease